MIEIAGQTYEFSDPIFIGVAAAAIFALLVLLLLILALRRTGQSIAMTVPLTQQVHGLSQNLAQMGHGQSQLAGGLETVSKSQQMQLQTMEVRLAEVQRQMSEKLHENAMRSARSLSDLHERMNETLHGNSEKTSKSLGELQQRLETIDKAQTNIEKLSGDVLSLQDILSNKQTRGAFGEIQLNDIVSKAMPADSYVFQATLSNGKRADCLIKLPDPPGPIVIDAKFPLEAFEAFVNAESKDEQAKALSKFRTDVRTHIKAISERYLIEGETADGALMFVPSEAVYAEMHARLADVVREGFEARVWIVSPTTCMATLNTMRAILKDARMKEQAGAIRRELNLLFKDVDRLGTRVENLDRHFNMAAKDIEDIKISSEKAGKRARRLDQFEFDEEDTPEPLSQEPTFKHIAE